MMMWSYVDLGILLLFLISGFLGFARGLTQEVLGFLSWVGAFFLAFYGFPHMRPILSPYISNSTLVDLAGGVGIFVVSFLILTLLSRTMSQTVKGGVLSGMDRSFGVLFGLVRGWILLSILFIILTYFVHPAQWPNAITQARFLGLGERGAQLLIELVPSANVPKEVTEYLSKQMTLTPKEVAKSVETLSTLVPESELNKDAPQKIEMIQPAETTP